jgi:hypothetical protein
MSCEDCEKFQETGNAYYWRLGTANIGITACKKHAKQVLEILNKSTKVKK